jgi:ribosomal protein S24E
MENKIITQEKNPYLGRKEVSLVLTAEKNPTKKEIVEILKSDENLTVVKLIKGSFGDNKFNVRAIVYENQAAKDLAETIPRHVRMKAAAEAKKAAEAARAAGGAK